MATKIKKTWRMSEEAWGIITAYAEKEGCNDTEALEQIIRDYATYGQGSQPSPGKKISWIKLRRDTKQITRICGNPHS